MCKQAQESSPLPAEAAPPQEGGQPEEQGFSYYRDPKGEPIDPLMYLG